MNLVRLLTLAWLIPTAAAQVNVEIQAVVVDVEGRGLLGATVTLVRLLSTAGEREIVVIEKEANSRAEARLSIVEPGLYIVRAHIANFVPTQVGPFLVSSQASNDPITMEARLLVNIDNPYRNIVGVPEEVLGVVEDIDWHLSEDELNSIRELIFRRRIEAYDSIKPQIKDPEARRYCLAFDVAGKRRHSAPDDFLRRFSDHPHIYSLDWCNKNRGRLLSVGPVELETSNLVLMWSFSWVGDSPGGGSDCFHKVLHDFVR
jgi:hypothetical protein